MAFGKIKYLIKRVFRPRDAVADRPNPDSYGPPTLPLRRRNVIRNILRRHTRYDHENDYFSPHIPEKRKRSSSTLTPPENNNAVYGEQHVKMEPNQNDFEPCELEYENNDSTHLRQKNGSLVSEQAYPTLEGNNMVADDYKSPACHDSTLMMNIDESESHVLQDAEVQKPSMNLTVSKNYATTVVSLQTDALSSFNDEIDSRGEDNNSRPNQHDEASAEQYSVSHRLTETEMYIDLDSVCVERISDELSSTSHPAGEDISTERDQMDVNQIYGDQIPACNAEDIYYPVEDSSGLIYSSEGSSQSEFGSDQIDADVQTKPSDRCDPVTFENEFTTLSCEVEKRFGLRGYIIDALNALNEYRTGELSNVEFFSIAVKAFGGSRKLMALTARVLGNDVEVLQSCHIRNQFVLVNRKTDTLVARAAHIVI